MMPNPPPLTSAHTSALPIVTLTDDREFRGIAFGRYVDADGNRTGDWAVCVSKPGQTQLRGCVHIHESRIEIVD